MANAHGHYTSRISCWLFANWEGRSRFLWTSFYLEYLQLTETQDRGVWVYVIHETTEVFLQ